MANQMLEEEEGLYINPDLYVPSISQSTAGGPIQFKSAGGVGHGGPIQTESLACSGSRGEVHEAVPGITPTVNLSHRTR